MGKTQDLTTDSVMKREVVMERQIVKWKAEHVDFLRLLDLLELQISLFHEGATPRYDVMLDIVYYLTHFADRFHHPREDVAITKLGERDPSVRALIQRVLGEHKVIAAAGKQLVEQLDAVLNGALLTRESVEVAAATYLTYYRQHMAQEEKELFPLADKWLLPADWKSVAAAIPSEDDPLFGKNVKERYRALHRQIELATGKWLREKK